MTPDSASECPACDNREMRTGWECVWCPPKPPEDSVTLDRWMSGGVVENDAEEARSEALRAERANEPHPEDCTCRPCLIDRYDPAEENR